MQVNLSLQKGDINEVLDRLEELIDKISDRNYRVDNAKELIHSIRNAKENKEGLYRGYAWPYEDLSKWYLDETVKNRLFSQDSKSCI